MRRIEAILQHLRWEMLTTTLRAQWSVGLSQANTNSRVSPETPM